MHSKRKKNKRGQEPGTETRTTNERVTGTNQEHTQTNERRCRACSQARTKTKNKNRITNKVQTKNWKDSHHCQGDS